MDKPQQYTTFHPNRSRALCDNSHRSFWNSRRNVTVNEGQDDLDLNKNVEIKSLYHFTKLKKKPKNKITTVHKRPNACHGLFLTMSVNQQFFP